MCPGLAGLLTGEPVALVCHHGPMAARAPAERRFVGRHAELAELGARLGGAGAGGSTPVLVEGDPGIGKSALLTELGHLASSQGWQVARGAAWDDLDAPPYWPWTQVVRSLKGLTRGTDLARVVLDDPADAEHLERFELFDATTDLVLRASRRRPVLVLLDDLHAADAASLALTRFVARQIGDHRVLIVGALRPADLDRRPEVRSHVDELAAAGHVVRLAPLDVAEVAELIGDVDLGADPADVHAVTAGNPLFVEQLRRSGTAIGLAAGAASDGSGPDRRPGDALRAAIERRLADLPASQALVLGALGVVGHELTIAELEELVSAVDPQLVPGVHVDLDELGRAGLVQHVDGGPVVETGHSLIADAAEAALDPAWSQRLHGRAAALIGDDPDRSGERAHHLLRAGVAHRDEAVKACRLAADHASAVDAHEEAVEHLTRALDLLDLECDPLGRQLRSSARPDPDRGSGVDPGVDPGVGPAGADRARARIRLELLLALGRERRLAGRPDDADESFHRAAELADRLGDPEARAAAALRGGVQLFVRSELDGGRVDRMLAALGGLPPGDSPLRARLLAELAAVGGTDPISIARASEAVAMARRLDDLGALGTALVAEQTTDLGPGTLRRRLATAREILSIARRVGDPALATQGRYLMFGAALEQGDLRGVDTGGTLDGAGVLVERTHARLASWVAVTRALLDGRADEAEAIAGRGLDAGIEADDPFALRVYGGQLGVIRRMQGRFAELEGIYEAQWAANPDEMVWPAALASIWATKGRRDAARGALDAIGSVERIGGGLHWLVTTALAAEAAAIVDHDQLGQQLWERLLPFADRMVPVNLAAATLGPVGLPLGALGASLGHVDEALAHFERAVRVCARMRAVPWLVDAQIALAEALIEHRGGADPDRHPARGSSAASPQRRTRELIDEAVVTARQYGFDRQLAAAEALRGRLVSGRTTRRTADLPRVGPRPSVSVLGAFEVASADGRVATWSSRKARELLKILVAKRGSPVHREVLMDLLWPGEDPATVANRLSVALWTVRRAFDPDRRSASNDFVAADRQTIRLRVDAVDVDAERFLHAAQAALSMRGVVDEAFDRLVAAAALHPGPALPDEPYAEWASGLQREVHIAHTSVLAAIAELAVERGDDLAAADAFRGLVESDPCDRVTHEGLVAALERIGASAMAEVERRRFDDAMRPD